MNYSYNGSTDDEVFLHGMNYAYMAWVYNEETYMDGFI